MYLRKKKDLKKKHGQKYFAQKKNMLKLQTLTALKAKIGKNYGDHKISLTSFYTQQNNPYCLV